MSGGTAGNNAVRVLYAPRRTEEKRKIRVAFYVRVSKKTDDQLHSFQAQKEACQVTLGQHPEYELVHIYADPGLTGTIAQKRPGFMALIRDVEAGLIDLVITKSLSRWARNTVESITYIGKVLDKGANLIFERENIDTREQYSMLAVGIISSLCQDESRSISDNTRIGIQWRFKEGRARWCPLYGYTRGKKEYEIVPEEAAVVRRIFQDYEAGKSLKQIANALNEAGTPASRGGKWRECRVHEILKNEKYAGHLLMQKYYTESHITHKPIRNAGEQPMYLVENHHAALVSQEQFDRAQKILSMREMKSGRGNTYPFGEMLRCPLCGQALCQRSVPKQYQRKKAWVCQSGCGGFALGTDAIEGAVLRACAGMDAGSAPREMKEAIPARDAVDFLTLDRLVERIEIGPHTADGTDDYISIFWKHGGKSVLPSGVSCGETRRLAERFARQGAGERAEYERDHHSQGT